MTPSAEPTSQRADIAAHLVPADLLSGGEIIILAIKPSGWFVLLASLPVVISAVVVAVIAYVVDIYNNGWSASEAVICLCAAIVVIRVTGACWQWLGRTYVLTNRRIVTVRGLVRVRISASAMTDIRRAVLTATIAERLFGTGSIYYLTDSENAPSVTWNIIAKPDEVYEIVAETIERAK